MRKTIPVRDLRPGDVVIGDHRQAPVRVTGINAHEFASVPDLAVLGPDGVYAFTAHDTADDCVTVQRDDAPMVAYTELRFLQRGMRLLLDVWTAADGEQRVDALGVDYDPHGDGLVVYRVVDWCESRRPNLRHSLIRVHAVPLDPRQGPPVMFTGVPTCPVRLAVWPETAVLEAERDDALARLERGEVERPGVGAVA